MPGRFVDVRATASATRWELPLETHLLTASGAIQGGAAFGAAIEALEAATSRPLVFASAQFVRHAGPTGVLTLDVDVAVDGARTTQGRVRAHVDSTDVLHVAGALGAREPDADGTWAVCPDVDPPARSAVVTMPSNGADIGDVLDVRVAAGRADAALDGTRGHGRWVGWAHRLDAGGPLRTSELAILGDLNVLGISDAVGRRLTGNSIDNTLRVVSRDETEWVLLDVAVDAIRDGYAHVGAHLWSEAGALLAVATQTLVVREAQADGRPRRTTRRIVGA